MNTSHQFFAREAVQNLVLVKIEFYHYVDYFSFVSALCDWY